MPPEAAAPRREYVPPPHQARVDAVQAAIRAEGPRPGLFRPPPVRPARSEREIDLRVAEEVELAARHIEQVGDALVGDPAFLHRHGATLQALDLITRICATSPTWSRRRTRRRRRSGSASRS